MAVRLKALSFRLEVDGIAMTWAKEVEMGETRAAFEVGDRVSIGTGATGVPGVITSVNATDAMVLREDGHSLRYAFSWLTKMTAHVFKVGDAIEVCRWGTWKPATITSADSRGSEFLYVVQFADGTRAMNGAVDIRAIAAIAVCTCDGHQSCDVCDHPLSCSVAYCMTIAEPDTMLCEMHKRVRLADARAVAAVQIPLPTCPVPTCYGAPRRLRGETRIHTWRCGCKVAPDSIEPLFTTTMVPGALEQALRAKGHGVEGIHLTEPLAIAAWRVALGRAQEREDEEVGFRDRMAALVPSPESDAAWREYARVSNPQPLKDPLVVAGFYETNDALVKAIEATTASAKRWTRTIQDVNTGERVQVNKRIAVGQKIKQPQSGRHFVSVPDDSVPDAQAGRAWDAVTVAAGARFKQISAGPINTHGADAPEPERVRVMVGAAKVEGLDDDALDRVLAASAAPNAGPLDTVIAAANEIAARWPERVNRVLDRIGHTSERPYRFVAWGAGCLGVDLATADHQRLARWTGSGEGVSSPISLSDFVARIAREDAES